MIPGKSSPITFRHLPEQHTSGGKEMDKGKAFGDKTGSPNVLMIYETERAEQYRGVPHLAPVIEALKQLTRYSEAEMMAAVINGFLPSSLHRRATSDIGFGGVVDDEDKCFQ